MRSSIRYILDADDRVDVLHAATKVLQAFLWLYEVWEAAFLEERFMDTELKSLDLPCSIDDFCKIQVRFIIDRSVSQSGKEDSLSPTM